MSTGRADGGRLRGALAAITPLGWYTLAIGAAGLVAGVGLRWVEGWFVAVVALLLFAIALPFLLGSRAYEVHLEVARPNVVAGGSVEAEVLVENASGRPQLPAVVELPVGDALRELALPLLGVGQQARLPVSAAAARRGVIRVGPLTVARRDPVGLLRRELSWPDSRLVHVHPVTVPLPPGTAGLVRDLEGQASRRLADADLSFHAIREYQPSDPLRHVHWKATAKTGALMVRQYEETQTARLAVLFDAVREEYASDDEFELAVSAAASLSVQAVRDGRERFVASAWAPGRMRPSIDGVEELPSRDATQLLDAWAELRPISREDAREPGTAGRRGARKPVEVRIESLARGLAESRRPLSVVVVVTGSRPELSRIRRAAVAFGPEVQVLAVRCDWLAAPGAQQLDGLSVCTVGALGDLPRLLIRGLR